MSTLFRLNETIRKEFTVESDGRAFASRRAISRLCGVDHTAIKKLLERGSCGDLERPKSLEVLVGQSFEAGDLIPDIVATGIIEYYAFDAGRHCKEQARLVYRAFAAIGFRTWIQSELGWKATPIPAPQTRMEMLAEIAQQMVEQERQLKQHSQVLNELVANKEQAEEELKALPLSADAPAEIPTRGRINMIVRNCVRRSNAAYSAIWDKLYLELYYRYKFDTKARCRHSGRKPLDQIEADGMLEALYAIASEVLA